MAERDLNGRICAAIKELDPFRVENPVHPGTPDINYRDGWIEDKQIEFPKGYDTVIRIPHYTKQQRACHMRRRRAGGLCWVAVEDSGAGHLYVFDGMDAAQHLGLDWTRDGFARNAALHLERWDARRFRNWLISCKPE